MTDYSGMALVVSVGCLIVAAIGVYLHHHNNRSVEELVRLAREALKKLGS